MTDEQAQRDLPLACTLGPEDGSARRQRWQLLDEIARRRAEPKGDELEIRYDARPGVHEELLQLVDAEAECCAFISWRVALEGDQVVLLIRAAPDRPDDLESMALMFGVEL